MKIRQPRRSNASHSKRRQTHRRRCRLETLETRRLLAAEVLFSDSFEAGQWAGNWVEDSQNDWFTSSQRSTDGSYSAEVDGRATDATLTLSDPIDLSGYSSAELTFDWLIESGFDSGEYLALDISSNGGASWVTNVRRLDGNVSQENTWHSETVDLTPYASSNLLVRFRAKVSRSNEDANVDNVKISGTPSGPPEISITDASATEGDVATVGSTDVFVTAGSGGLDRPRGITFGPDGNLYVTSVETDSVLRYDGVSGAFLDEFVAPGSGGLNAPRDLVFDSSGRLLVTSAQTNQILRYNGTDGTFDQVLVDVAGGLDKPQSLTYKSSTEELFVSSSLSSEILKYDALSGAFLGAFVTANSGGLSDPKWQLFTDAGDMLVVSQIGDEILKYDASGDFQGVFYAVPASDASTTILMGIARGPDGNLLVGESNDLNTGRVIRLDADTGAFIDEYVSVGDGGLNSPRSIITDSDGNVYVVSYETDEVLRYTPGGNAAFTVSLSSPSQSQVTVDFDTADITATAGSDYVAVNGQLTFEPGVTTRTIIVPTIDDDLPETDETFQILLSNPIGATIVDPEANGTIQDDGDVGNQPPTADAGADQTLSDNDGTGSETVTLIGSGTDPDGSIVAYEWTQGAIVLGNSSSISPSLGVGTHTLTLTVTDNEGATGSDTVVVTINANQGPSADAGADQSVSDADGSGDQVVTLIGSGNDADGSIVSYQWSEGATVLGNTASISPSLSVGTHTLTLSVTDNGGATASDTVVITVAANQAPTANAGADQTVTDSDDNGSEAVALVGSGSDADGSIVSYQWTEGATVLGNTASISPTLSVGTHTLTLTVTDNGGATASDTVDVTVEAPAAGPNLSHGQLASAGSTWQTVTLGKSYTSMVVVATPRYNTGSGPGVVRIDNVTPNSFDVRVDNVGSSAFSGGVHYIAVEEGVYDEPGQYKLEAVKYSESQTSRKNGWVIDTASQGYQQSYSSPVVVGQVMSANDPDWSVFWASSGSRTSPPSTSALNVGKHVAEDPDTTRSNETIGYLVIEATQSGTIEGLPFVAGVGGDSVRGVGNGTYQYSYDAMPNAKTAVLSSAGMDGGDGGWPVLMGTNPVPASTGTIDLSIDEDQLGDSERNHTSEQVAYFVIDPPLPADPMDVNGDSHVTAADALRVINRLARTTPSSTESASELEALDVNQDGILSALDALVVINRLSQQTATQAIAPIASTEAVDAVFTAPSDEDEENEVVDKLLGSIL